MLEPLDCTLLSATEEDDMGKRARLFLVFCSVMSAIAPSIRAQAPPQTSDGWKPVETALRRSGEAQPDGASKFSMPRRDLSVTVQGTQIKAGLALGTWAAFKTDSARAEQK